MKRLAQNHLLSWFKQKDRKPLILRGARQVGKSTLVRLFAQTQNLDLIEINLEKLSLSSLNNDHFDIQKLLDEVQLRSQKQIKENSLIFFDEIQESPKLLKALRYFYEERPNIAVVTAGSLLEFTLSGGSMSFPVGRVEFAHLGPMTFSEFLMATGHEFLLEKISNLEFSEEVVNLAKEQLKNYYYVGGMPYCVKLFAETKSLVPVRDAQEQILQTYIADFPKYNSRIGLERLQNIFFSCAHQIGKKVVYQKIDPDSQSKTTRKVLDLLIKARVLLPCYHSDANSTPLIGERDLSVYKLYFLDIGLLNAIMNLDFQTLDKEMANNFNTKGTLAEQFAAQHLAHIQGFSRNPDLNYWLRDKASQKSEIDFLIQNKMEILPIEVKATATGHLKSLFQFIGSKNFDKGIKVSLEDYSVRNLKTIYQGNEKPFTLYSVPHYAIEFILKILEQ